MLKCNRINIFDIVKHEGKNKTVIAMCLNSIIVSDETPDQVIEMVGKTFSEVDGFKYGPWIDLDEIEMISK